MLLSLIINESGFFLKFLIIGYLGGEIDGGRVKWIIRYKGRW